MAGSTSLAGSKSLAGSGGLGRSAAWALRARVRCATGVSGRRGALGTGSAEGGGSIGPIAEAAGATGEAERVGAPARQRAWWSIVEGVLEFFGGSEFRRLRPSLVLAFFQCYFDRGIS